MRTGAGRLKMFGLRHTNMSQIMVVSYDFIILLVDNFNKTRSIIAVRRANQNKPSDREESRL